MSLLWKTLCLPQDFFFNWIELNFLGWLVKQNTLGRVDLTAFYNLIYAVKRLCSLYCVFADLIIAFDCLIQCLGGIRFNMILMSCLLLIYSIARSWKKSKTEIGICAIHIRHRCNLIFFKSSFYLFIFLLYKIPLNAFHHPPTCAHNVNRWKTLVLKLNCNTSWCTYVYLFLFKNVALLATFQSDIIIEQKSEEDFL